MPVTLSLIHIFFSVVEKLRQGGFRILMDDFGSGYSSLNMLKEAPVDEIKLDMRFLSCLLYTSITDPEELTLQTPESFFKRFHINMKIHHEVISIHPRCV